MLHIPFSRQPRFLPDYPRGEVEVPNPPSANDKPEISWFAILAPPIVMLVITLLIALTMRSIFLMLSIAATVITLIVSLTNAASQIRKYKKKKKERESKYLQFITDTRSELAISGEQQKKALIEMNPGPDTCIERIAKLDSRLWERTASSHDFLSLRIGVGNAPLATRIKYTKQAIVMENDPLMMEPHRLAMEFDKIADVPVNVNLAETEICGIAGERQMALHIVKLMLLQLVTHHGYDDVRVVILSSEESLRDWDWARMLPHFWDDEFQVRYLLCGKAFTHQVLPDLHTLLKRRESNTVGGTLPHYVFVIEDASLLENEPIYPYLYNGHAKLGVSSIFVAPNASMLPMNCRTVVAMSSKSGEIVDRESGEKTSFVPDRIEELRLEEAVRRMAALRIKQSSVNFNLPKSITLLDMLKTQTIEEMDMVLKWQTNKTYKGMRVPIGAGPGGELFDLDLHETGHGPHGLVAGTTGSGKSELLQSIVISLAVHYHPHDVVFVLIDYKGGGMADVFQGLPHLVGTITNLGGNQTTRALLSIKSELLRRQRLFAQFGVNSIDKYQKLYDSRQPADMPAIPHLVMIADEFAELKQDQPDFMKELVSAARVGRSLGIHLILATQKPGGVVDEQIWSNSKFRICLKVQDEADSNEVIKRPDAARIKEPGRAFLQVGSDELFEMFQSAYSGADYDPQGEMLKSENRTKRIYKVALHGKREQIYPLEEEKIAKTELPSQLQAMVARIIQCADEHHIQPLDGPWLPPLPETLYLDDLASEFAHPVDGNKPLLRVPVGVVDDPREQRQMKLQFDFAQEGNLIVYGAAGTGKSVMLRTLCISMANLYTPHEVNFYVMDFGGTSLLPLRSLPHCGGVITLEQETLINQFVQFMFREMEERKRCFEQHACGSFNDYRAKGQQMAAILIVIDNYFALSETYEDVDARMIVLAREGAKYGIYLVATASNAALVRYKFAVNFKMAISYPLIEKSEYNGIVGRTEGLEPMNLPGRGLVRGTPPLEFQTALPEYRDQDEQTVLQKLRSCYTERAKAIPVMPARIDIRKMDANLHDEAKDFRLAIGLSDDDLQPVYLDLMAHPVVMVAGDAMSGKSTLLSAWVTMMSNAEVYALDSSGMGLFAIMEYPHVSDLSEADDELVIRLTSLLDERRKQLIDCRRNQGDVRTLIASWKTIIFVIDRLSELTSGSQYALKELLERIVKQERGMKIAIFVADNTSELNNNWDDLGKAIKEEQTGVLIGSLREQNLYNVKIPYGAQEKQMEAGDGYMIQKNKFISMRFASL